MLACPMTGRNVVLTGISSLNRQMAAMKIGKGERLLPGLQVASDSASVFERDSEVVQCNLANVASLHVSATFWYSGTAPAVDITASATQVGREMHVRRRVNDVTSSPTWLEAVASGWLPSAATEAIQETCDSSGGCSKADFQSRLFTCFASESHLRAFASGLGFAIVDTHTSGCLDGLSPDIVICSKDYAKTGAGSVCATVIRAVLTLKKRGERLDDAAILGQLTQSASRIFRDRPVQFLDVLACNPDEVVYYRFHRPTAADDPYPSSVDSTAPLMWSAGLEYFGRFLAQPDQLENVCAAVASAGSDIRGFLGSGATSHVFRCHRRGQSHIHNDFRQPVVGVMFDLQRVPGDGFHFAGNLVSSRIEGLAQGRGHDPRYANLHLKGRQRQTAAIKGVKQLR